MHPLAVANIVIKTKYFKDFDVPEIAAFLSCFTSLAISQDDKSQKPNTKNSELNKITSDLMEQVLYFDKLEIQYALNTGANSEIHYDMQVPVLEWCKVNDASGAAGILRSAYDAGVSTGEFVKALLKINNTALELSRACEELNELELLKKLQQIPHLLLKSIVTPESLYV